MGVNEAETEAEAKAEPGVVGVAGVDGVTAVAGIVEGVTMDVAIDVFGGGVVGVADIVVTGTAK